MYNYKSLQKEVLENRKELHELREKMESLLETMEVLADRRAMKAIAESEKDFKAGRFKRWDEVKGSI